MSHGIASISSNMLLKLLDSFHQRLFAFQSRVIGDFVLILGLSKSSFLINYIYFCIPVREKF